jgi:hypothetical protein
MWSVNMPHICRDISRLSIITHANIVSGEKAPFGLKIAEIGINQAFSAAKSATEPSASSLDSSQLYVRYRAL